MVHQVSSQSRNFQAAVCTILAVIIGLVAGVLMLASGRAAASAAERLAGSFQSVTHLAAGEAEEFRQVQPVPVPTPPAEGQFQVGQTPMPPVSAFEAQAFQTAPSAVRAPHPGQ